MSEKNENNAFIEELLKCKAYILVNKHDWQNLQHLSHPEEIKVLYIDEKDNRWIDYMPGTENYHKLKYPE